MFSCLQILEAFLWFVLITLLNVTLIILTLSVSRLLNLLLRLVFFSIRRRHTCFDCDWSSDVCSSDLMAARVPVIATASEGAREIIDDQQTGRLVPIGNSEALADAISGLLADSELRERLSAEAHRRVRERFSLERMLDATEEVYREVLR